VESSRNEIVGWVATQILPHERDVRAWLRRTGAPEHDIDDFVQEAYCRLAALHSVSHIGHGRAYFFQTVRNIAVERMRRARVVSINYVTEIDSLNVVDNEPSPERIAASRCELRRVKLLIESLPEKCREIFKLRRMQGISQREIARLLGVTENVVEMQTTRGLRLILQALAKGDEQSHSPGMAKNNDGKKRQGN
jgi:RNA polymerase sigma factor (sigma-70 family)